MVRTVQVEVLCLLGSNVVRSVVAPGSHLTRQFVSVQLELE